MYFRLGLSGLQAASSDLEVTANNIANANTTGFKRSRAEFADVFSQSGQAVSQTAIGDGVRLQSVSQQFDKGDIDYTSRSLDLALSGEGFFTVRDDNGLAYTRAGAFSADRDGYVINGNGQKLQVFPTLDDGGFDTSATQDLQLSQALSSPQATSKAHVGVNLPADATAPVTGTFDPDDPTSYTNATSLTVYDSLGDTHTAKIYFNKESANNAWSSRLYIDGAANGGAKSITFDPSGSVQAPANGVLDFPPQTLSNGAEPLDVDLNLADATQYGDSFDVNALTQDGHAQGRLSSIDIGNNGIVSARYTNGQSNPLGEIALTNFSNPEGLQQLGDTTWAETYTSGEALRGTAGTASFGQIQSGALEGSNVDLTGQLVDMIKAQRNFQANAKVISTADKITNAVMQIRT